MTSTGSCSAIPASTSTGSVPPDRSTRPSTSRPASSSTHGRSRSTCPRANAVLISRRSRVWSGGSISRIALRWIRLKLPNRSAGSLSRQIRPSRRSRRTALASAWVNASHSPRPSCHCTGATARGPGERRVRVGDDRGVGRGRAGAAAAVTGASRRRRPRRPSATLLAWPPASAPSAPAAAAPEGINPKAPCPCGSGRRYKHCHGSGYAPPVTRPFEGLPGEADWVAMRELVPAATATLRTTDGRDVTLASVLPGGTPGAGARQRRDPARRPDADLVRRRQPRHRDGAGRRARGAGRHPGRPGPDRRRRLGRAAAAGAARPDARRSRSPCTRTSGSGWRAPTPARPRMAGLEHANEAILPTVRLAGPRRRVLGAAGQRAGPPALGAARSRRRSCSTRWPGSSPRSRSCSGEGTRYAGAFRALGLVVPVWDLPADTPAEDWIGPATRVPDPARAGARRRPSRSPPTSAARGPACSPGRSRCADPAALRAPGRACRDRGVSVRTTGCRERLRDRDNQRADRG